MNDEEEMKVEKKKNLVLGTMMRPLALRPPFLVSVIVNLSYRGWEPYVHTHTFSFFLSVILFFPLLSCSCLRGTKAA